MAAAPAQFAPRRLKKHEVPDDALVYREYAHQVKTGGEWGAYTRTAKVCKVSHQHVRNVVERHGPKKVDPALEYEPAPGEVEYAQICESGSAQIATSDFLRQLIEEETPTPEPPIMSTSKVHAIATMPEIATVERGIVLPAYDIFANRVSVNRTKESHQTLLLFLAGMNTILTGLMFLVATKSLGLSLALFPEVMAMWWVLLQLRRVVY